MIGHGAAADPVRRLEATRTSAPESDALTREGEYGNMGDRVNLDPE